MYFCIMLYFTLSFNVILPTRVILFFLWLLVLAENHIPRKRGPGHEKNEFTCFCRRFARSLERSQYHIRTLYSVVRQLPPHRGKPLRCMLEFSIWCWTSTPSSWLSSAALSWCWRLFFFHFSFIYEVSYWNSVAENFSFTRLASPLYLLYVPLRRNLSG